MSNEKLDKIIEVVSKNTGIPIKDININSKSEDFDKWDSFAHVKIILEIEKINKKIVSAGKMGSVNSIKSILNLIS
jgi:acyl carrier protein